MSRPRVVVAGLGDSGLLTAIHLARADVDVVGVSSKPGLVSGQELGLRLARPERWARDYRIGFDRFRRLDSAEVVHAELTHLDPVARTVTVDDGTTARPIPYDVLVVATGVSNGFWRRPALQTEAEVTATITAAHARLAAAGSLLVVGGGAAAVASALQCATRWPALRVTLAFPGERALPQHHPNTWTHVRRRLLAAGVDLRPGHRAVVPDGFDCDRITTGPVAWSTGQPPYPADAVLWAIGRVRPNTGWLPAEALDEQGFVRVGPDLRVPGLAGVFAVGDVAATDPLRTSARGRADRLVAANVRAHLAGRPLGEFRPARRRWGSVLGVEDDGLRVFTASGRPFRFPAWAVGAVLQPWIVRRGIYRGIRGSRR
ncbi:FAD-dependent oxidoreductase [Nocardioides sp. WV_118_6]|uniref:FAD-dependent oxidoreductase n=1 Tax=Nocardioides simplex TaxID=2045 RepID=UPI0021503C7D|nr:FAD-dependent oxidoreductase [Pimelobacter simplex]UUW92264.1 FAD-dependent oxidoreductase [Pimelobacter simplex]UUW96091.1 FAD-dependent oxidoreductase [Pimelobacter simplex]